MENYLKKELGGCPSKVNNSMNSLPLDLTVPKKPAEGVMDVPSIRVTQDLKPVQMDLFETLPDSQIKGEDHSSIQESQIPNNSSVTTNNSLEATEIAQNIICSVLTDLHSTKVEAKHLIKSENQEKTETAMSEVTTASDRAKSEQVSSPEMAKLSLLDKPDSLSAPTRIPSRKNSSGTSMSEDLRNLESKLERYISKTESEGGSETSEISDSSAQSGSSVSNVVNRLHNGQTASTRARAANNRPNGPGAGGHHRDVHASHHRDEATGHRDPMTSSFRGKLPEPHTTVPKGKQSDHNQKNGSTQDKDTGTASMLKSTLRKMSRFSISSNKGKKEEDEKGKGSTDEKKEGKLRGRLTAKAGPLSPPTVNRSRSFKEPERPGRVDSRNQAYTSSLRRPKNKLQTDQDNVIQGHIQRSGTGVERSSSMRRSTSASRGGARIVKKSRTVQTQLTRDAGRDLLEDTGEAPQGNLQFQVWLPELLGDDTEQVETHIETSNEPVDVRKNRQLTLENMKLQREVEKLKSHSTENESLKKDIKLVKLKLEEEQKSRMSIQLDLEKNHERVRGILCGMEAVERELESRGDTVHHLEQEVSHRKSVEEDLGGQLERAGRTLQAQKHELERSMAAQKTLIQQLQESEAEARELQEFMQAEKNTLVEALRDGEGEQVRLRALVEEKEEQSSLLVRRAEQRTQELQSSRSELNSLKERAREMLLSQGAELSRASIAVAQLTARIDQLIPNQDEEEVSSSSGCELELGMPRRSSQFLVTPTENLDFLTEFSKAIMSASTGSETMGDGVNSLSNLATAIADRKHTQTESTSTQGGLVGVPSLADQIDQVDILLTRLISTKELSSSTHQPNDNLPDIANGNNGVVNNDFIDVAEDLENIDLGNIDITRNIILQQNKALTQLRSLVEEREESLSELKGKFIRNQQILNSNWQQAEEEVKKVDQEYHETVNRVMNTLNAMPEVVSANSPLHQLLLSLKELDEADGLNGNNTSDISSRSLKSKSESLLSRSLICDQRQSTMKGQSAYSNSNLMSQSLLLQAGGGEAFLRGGGVSEPCLLKSPSGGLPPSILAASPVIMQDDLNANQSL